jgi:hypothetical protein
MTAPVLFITRMRSIPLWLPIRLMLSWMRPRSFSSMSYSVPDFTASLSWLA